MGQERLQLPFPQVKQAPMNVNRRSENASGTESTPTTFQTPADEATVTAPTITGVTGNSTAGYEVKGTADANATVEI